MCARLFFRSKPASYVCVIQLQTTGDGAAVYQDVNTDVTYGNMYFTQNVARNGGAVFLAQGATATFQVGSITRNRATVRFNQ